MFAGLFVYIVIIYIYFKYIVTGELPSLAPARLKPGAEGAAKRGEVSEKLSTLLPPPKPQLEKGKGSSKLLEELLPTKNKNPSQEASGKKKDRIKKLKHLLPKKKGE